MTIPCTHDISNVLLLRARSLYDDLFAMMSLGVVTCSVLFCAVSVFTENVTTLSPVVLEEEYLPWKVH